MDEWESSVLEAVERRRVERAIVISHGGTEKVETVWSLNGFAHPTASCYFNQGWPGSSVTSQNVTSQSVSYTHLTLPTIYSV